MLGSVDTGGGNLVHGGMADRVIDIARSASVSLAAGAQTFEMDQGTVKIGKLTADPTAQWRPEGVDKMAEAMGRAKKEQQKIEQFTVDSSRIRGLFDVESIDAEVSRVEGELEGLLKQRDTNTKNSRSLGFSGEPFDLNLEKDIERLNSQLERLAVNTVRKHIQIAKQFFTAAVRKRTIPVNPFAGLKSTVRPNPERFYFSSREEIAKVIDACPDAQWRLLLALSWFTGLRCPSVHLGLRWADIDWGNDRMTVSSPKTEHHTGGGSRVVPIFPELRPYLEAVWDEALDGTDIHHHPLSVHELDSADAVDADHQAGRAEPVAQADPQSAEHTGDRTGGPIPDPRRLFVDGQFTASRHYLQVTDGHFTQATKIAGTHGDIGGNELQTGEHGNENTPKKKDLCRNLVHYATRKVAVEGLERSSFSPGKRPLCKEPGTHSGTVQDDSGQIPPGLAIVVKAWPFLSEAVQEEILQVVRREATAKALD